MTTNRSRPRSGCLRPRSTGRTLSRPNTSLGFSGHRGHNSYSKSGLGFDVQEYFRQHGPGAELTVGVNGEPSRDQALLNYVQDCRVEALLDRVEDARLWIDDSLHGTTGKQVTVERVPLCWDTVLHKAEVTLGAPYRSKRRPQTAIVQSRPLVASQTQSRYSLTCEEINDHNVVEDEDKLDMREIAQKYPDLCVLDIEERDEDTQRKEGRDTVTKQPLAVFITPRSTGYLDNTKNDVKKRCNLPSASPSPQSSTAYASIVRRRLAHYLH